MDYSDKQRLGKAYLERFGAVPEGIGRVASVTGEMNAVHQRMQQALATGVPVDWSRFAKDLWSSSGRPDSEAA